MKKEINAIITIAARDFTKFVRDRARILATFIFPILFIGALGGSLQANIGDNIGYNFMTFVFTGVVGQSLFQSTASGIISLIEDRKSDFSQEIFVSPISRYSIIVGKLLGETTISFTQVIGIIGFSAIIGVPLSPDGIIAIVPVSFVASFLGGAFGLLVLSNLSSERSANQIFPFVIFPQFFLAGVFNPIKELPLVLDILSRISPMRYAVDLVRGIYYFNSPDYSKVVLMSPVQNMIIISIMFLVFFVAGTKLFVSSEKNK